MVFRDSRGGEKTAENVKRFHSNVDGKGMGLL